jgi:hypothetical protein
MKWTKNACQPLAKKIYDAIKQDRLSIPDGKDVTARVIVGISTWNTLDVGRRRFAGRFVSVLARWGLLGLQQTRRDSSNHGRYRFT